MLETGKEKPVNENDSMPKREHRLKERRGLGTTEHINSPKACEATTNSIVAAIIHHRLPLRGNSE